MNAKDLSGELPLGLLPHMRIGVKMLDFIIFLFDCLPVTSIVKFFNGPGLLLWSSLSSYSLSGLKGAEKSVSPQIVVGVVWFSND